MNFENWQELWQKQPAPGAVAQDTITETIRRVRAGARSFDRTIFWRDSREVIAAIGVAAVFGFIAWAKIHEGAQAWDAIIATILPLGVAGFLLVDRARARDLRPVPNGTVVAELDHAIAELRHQHALLKNVLWWYLLPLVAGAALIMSHAILMASPAWWARLALVGITCAVLAAVIVPVYFLNQRVAEKELWPRLEELIRRRREFAAGEEN
jgi:hypothetical protein